MAPCCPIRTTSSCGARLQSGTYYIKVTGFGPADEPYVLRIREFTDTTSRSNAATLNLDSSASGTIDPEEDEDYFKLELSAATEVAIRASGFPDTVGELLRSNGTVIASNDDGYLPGGRRNFLIRESLQAGTYYVKVSSFDEGSDGPYSVYAAAITEPGSAKADAQPLTLGGAAGGNIDPAGDEDYFSLTLAETTYLTIGGVSEVTNISGGLTDENDLRAPLDSIHYDDFFIFEGRLDAGTYYLKVTGKEATDTGRYTVRAIVEGGYTYFVNRCSSIARSAGINDPLYGCQWHLKNDNQFRNGAGQDIRVEEVWPTYTGSGINVAVVDDGMHHQHEDLKDNVECPYFIESQLRPRPDRHLPPLRGPRHRGGRAHRGEGQQPRHARRSPRCQDLRIQLPGGGIRRQRSERHVPQLGDHGHIQQQLGAWGLRRSGACYRTLGNGGQGRRHRRHTAGKGVFYAWAGGNGDEYGDYSTLDEYANYHAVTAVCAVGHDDLRSDYSEAGANLWVCGPSSSGRVGQPRIATTDNGHRYRAVLEAPAPPLP